MKKILHFLFPSITIIITVVFFLLFLVYDGFKTAFDYTLLFFFMFMLPLDLIIAIIKGLKNWLFKNMKPIDTVYSLHNQPQHTDFQRPHVDKPTNSTAVPKTNNKELEYFASLCAASCEFDKTQNHIDEITHGNVRYNDKRFDNVINDPEILSVVSLQKVKEYSEHIMKLCKSLGAEIQINGATYTKMYVILETIPAPGIRVRSILALQNDIEISIGMPTIMNVIGEKGYIGILLPIQYFVKTDINA